LRGERGGIYIKMEFERVKEKYKSYMRMKGYSARSIEHYEEALDRFFKYLIEDKGINRIQDVKREDITDYQIKTHNTKNKVTGRPLSIGYKSRILIVVKLFFREMVKTGEILYSPASDMEVPSAKRMIPHEVLTVKEIRKLLSTAKGNDPFETRDRAMMELFYSSGMRNTELRDLKLGDIDLDKKEVIIRKGKGGKSRVVPIGSIAAGWIDTYLKHARDKILKDKSNEYIFLHCRGERLSRRAPGDIISKYAKRAKIKKKVRAHMLRHTCATHLIKGGADIRYVQEFLGHKSLDSTQVYTRVDIGDLKLVHMKTHPRERA